MASDYLGVRSLKIRNKRNFASTTLLSGHEALEIVNRLFGMYYIVHVLPEDLIMLIGNIP
jgi:hypothetical protein